MTNSRTNLGRASGGRGIALLAILWCSFAGISGAAITDADIAALSSASPKQENEVKATASLGGFMLRVGFSLGAVVGLIALAAWGAKRYLPAQIAQGRGGPIEVVASRSIAAKKTLMLVRVNEKTVLIGVTPQGMQFLTDVDHGRGAWEDAALHAGIDRADELAGAKT